MNFADSLTAWKQSEEIVLAWIKKKYPQARLAEWYCPKFDIYVPEKRQNIEIKQDKKSEHTGNWVIETSFWWNPSWLVNSDSDWWVLVDHEYMHWVAPNDIKNCILYHGFRITEWTWPGDDKPKKAYLVPKDILAHYVSFTVSISEI